MSIAYTLKFESAAHHYVDIAAIITAPSAGDVDLMMAVWTPGSYMLREYARHVENVRATDAHGNALPVHKVKKNRWRVERDATGAGDVHINYRLYGREMTVRTNWIERDFAVLNGAPTFITCPQQQLQPHTVRVVLPATWKRTLTGLPAAEDGAGHTFVANNFDTLVDSPWLLGTPQVYEFDVDGKRHILACEGEGGAWDGNRARDDVQKIVQQNVAMWGSLPYDRYVFMNLLTDGKGGLEHKNSTVMMASRWNLRNRNDYLAWLGLVSHEFFHVWNIKRLRPKVLGPFDYEAEAHTPSLWIAEGLTAYYDDLNVCRAGLATAREYLELFSKSILQLQVTPGRLVQSLGEASFDAWIKFYRRDENTDNSGVSYYMKGTIVGFLLDAQIRRATVGRASLDDVMRLAYSRYSGEQGYTEAQFRELCSQVAGVSLDAWLQHAVDSTEELDYTPALSWFGLAFSASSPSPQASISISATTSSASSPSDDAPAPKAGWLGISVRQDGGRLIVSEIPRDTPGFAAGLNVDDELIAIDSWRLPASKWQERIRLQPPGSHADLLISRRDRLIRLPVNFAEEPTRAFHLIVDPNATPAQQANLQAWLKPT